MRVRIVQRGYTLVEMVIVLSFISILITLSAYGVRNALAREELDGWVRSIVSDLTAAQQMAVTRRAEIIAVFQSRTMIMSFVSGGGTFRQETLPAHIRFGTTETYALRFDRRGVPANSSGGALTSEYTFPINSTSGRSFTIHVEPGTGRVSYSEP